MTLAWLKMFFITIHRTFFNLKRAPKHWFFSKFAISCNIFWWETCTMEATRSWSVKFCLEMTWIDCHNFNLRNRTSVKSQKSLGMLTDAPKHRFFSKFAIFSNIFCWETCNMEKTRSWTVRFHHVPELA